MGMPVLYINTASIIGFFVIVFTLGFLLHFIFSKTGLYKNKVRAKGPLAKFLYIIIYLIALYIVLLVIFGVINLIDI